jgi:hypothetical protein
MISYTVTTPLINTGIGAWKLRVTPGEAAERGVADQTESHPERSGR